MDIEGLYKKVFISCVKFAVYNKKSIIDDVKEFMPLLNEFSKVFLEENIYGMDEEDYQLLQQLLINILMDIIHALENRDIVLLEDTIEYGLKEFLELFFPDEQEIIMLKEACSSEHFYL